jgi:hypothetical protein
MSVKATLWASGIASEERQAGIELRAGRQTTFIGDNRHIVLRMDLDAQGTQSTVARHAIPRFSSILTSIRE